MIEPLDRTTGSPKAIAKCDDCGMTHPDRPTIWEAHECRPDPRPTASDTLGRIALVLVLTGFALAALWGWCQ